MDSIENLREIKQLTKSFRGMKERFKTTSKKDFEIATSLFQKNLFIAYNINDIALNDTVLKSYNEIRSILSWRLNNNNNEHLRDEIEQTLFIFKAIMKEFMLQAAKLYD
jgi:hypothetical protein